MARTRALGVVDACLNGRAWIALVAVLLAGIVFFNVDLLQMNREIARNAEHSTTLKRENARLKLDLAKLTSTERIQEAAARRGMSLPAPGDVRYVRAGRDDARNAAKRVTEPTEEMTSTPTAPTTPVAAAPAAEPVAPAAPVAAPEPATEAPAPVEQQQPVQPAAQPQAVTGPVQADPASPNG